MTCADLKRPKYEQTLGPDSQQVRVIQVNVPNLGPRVHVDRGNRCVEVRDVGAPEWICERDYCRGVTARMPFDDQRVSCAVGLGMGSAASSRSKALGRREPSASSSVTTSHVRTRCCRRDATSTAIGFDDAGPRHSCRRGSLCPLPGRCWHELRALRTECNGLMPAHPNREVVTPPKNSRDGSGSRRKLTRARNIQWSSLTIECGRG